MSASVAKRDLRSLSLTGSPNVYDNDVVRSLAVIVFIVGVGASAIYIARRPTIAHGDVLAADLLKANAGTLSKIACDPAIPIGVDGASFGCDAVFESGKQQRIAFHMDRGGIIHPITEAPAPPSDEPSNAINKSDPWE